MRDAPRRVDPLNPRHDARCGAYRFDVICKCQLARRVMHGSGALPRAHPAPSRAPRRLTERPHTRQSKKAFPLESTRPLPDEMPVLPPVPFSGPTAYPDDRDGVGSRDDSGWCARHLRSASANA